MNQQKQVWTERLKGRFVVFDGPDGSGKSTQFERFTQMVQCGGVTVCRVREPGGTAIGEEIRKVLLDTSNDEMDLRSEMLLYMASRAQLVAQRIAPALRRGELVLADRFISSTLAYQGTAGGLSQADIVRVGQIAVGSCWPDLVVVFDADEETAQSRLNPVLDRMEQKGKDFHSRVRSGYLDQARADPDRYLVIDSTADVQTVFSALIAGLEAKSASW